jgi:hypothetical protein
LTTKFPSIPIPSADIPSMYQAVSAIRQTVQLLIVNQQQPSQPTLTKAAQIFATTAHVAQSINENTGPPGPAGAQGPSGPQGPAGPAGPPGSDSGGGLADAPSNGAYYGRVNASWGAVLAASSPKFSSLPPNAADDSAAASAGVPVSGIYRNGSILMVRVA